MFNKDMPISLLTYYMIDTIAWRNLFDKSPTATWFQTPEAYRFYQSVDGMQAFAYGVSEEGRLTGVVVGYTTKVKNKLKQHFTCRTIIYGGPILAEDVSTEALTTLLDAIRRLEENSIYIEIRNFQDYSKWKTIFEENGFKYQPHYDIHVRCNENHKLSDRRQRELKKAIRNGAIVQEAQSEQEIRDWYQILSSLYREKVRTPLPSLDFFLQFYRNRVGKYLLVKYEDKVIGGMMCPILPGKAIYEWYVCGLDEEYKDLYPSVVATHAAIEYAKSNGLSLFDFMGAGEPEIPYGVRDFKMEFGGELVEYGRFLCIRKPLLYKIGEIGVKWLKRK